MTVSRWKALVTILSSLFAVASAGPSWANDCQVKCATTLATCIKPCTEKKKQFDEKCFAPCMEKFQACQEKCPSTEDPETR